MKIKSILLYLYFFSCAINIHAQDPTDQSGDTDPDMIIGSSVVDLNDPIYNNLYSTSCSSKKKAAKDASRTFSIEYNQGSNACNIPVACDWGLQSDNTWTTICNTSSIFRDEGCLITCQAMILANSGFTDVTPLTWANTLCSYNPSGISESGAMTICGNCTDYLDVYSGSKVFQSYVFTWNSSSDNNHLVGLMKNQIDNGGWVIARINDILNAKTGGGCNIISASHHFVLIYGYNGDNPDWSDFLVSDPSSHCEDVCHDNDTWTLGDYSDDIPLNSGTYVVFYNVQQQGTATHLKINTPKTSTVGNILKLMFALLSTTEKSATATNDSYCNVIWKITNSAGFTYSINSDVPSFTFDQPGIYTISAVAENADGIYTDVEEIDVQGDPTSTSNSSANTDWTANGNDTYFCATCQPAPCPSAAPGIPNGLTSSKVSTSGFTVSWGTVACTTNYLVYIDVNGTQISGSPFTVTTNSLTESKLTEGVYYNVKVSAQNSYGVSATSQVLQIQTVNPPPPSQSCYQFNDFSYVGNNWYATAMNTTFEIQDNTVASGWNPHVWICWDVKRGCGTLDYDVGDYWAWTEEKVQYMGGTGPL